jgi:hypothetical protein
VICAVPWVTKVCDNYSWYLSIVLIIWPPDSLLAILDQLEQFPQLAAYNPVVVPVVASSPVSTPTQPQLPVHVHLADDNNPATPTAVFLPAQSAPTTTLRVVKRPRDETGELGGDVVSDKRSVREKKTPRRGIIALRVALEELNGQKSSRVVACQ